MLLTRSYVSVKTAYLPFTNANITTFFNTFANNPKPETIKKIQIDCDSGVK